MSVPTIDDDDYPIFTREELVSHPKAALIYIQVELYNELLDYIKTHNITYQDIGKKVGISKSQMNKIMTCDADIKISVLCKLSAFIGKRAVVNHPKIENYLKKESEEAFPYKFFDFYGESPQDRINANKVSDD